MKYLRRKLVLDNHNNVVVLWENKTNKELKKLYNNSYRTNQNFGEWLVKEFKKGNMKAY